MKKFKKYLKILSLALALATILAVFSLPQAEEYSVPTLYIDNRAWHMYSLFPLTEQNGAYLVPASFFGAVDGIEITFDDVRSCLLIQHGENFISVNTKTLNALLHTGEMLKTSVSLINDEYFVDSELCARALGFSIEVDEYYEKTVLRIKTDQDLMDFKTLVERNRVSEGALPKQTDKTHATAKRQSKTLTFVADFTKMKADEQDSLVSFLLEKNLRATVIIETNNLTDPQLFQYLLRVNAQGGSFIIRAKNTVQVTECNDLLSHLLRNRTRLVTGPDGLKAPIEAIGYIAQGQIDVRVSENPQNFEFQPLTTVEITSFTYNTVSSIEKWMAAAEENDVFIAPLNQRTGN